MLPPASYVMLAWHTARSILSSQPTTPIPLVHISNLHPGVTANDIAFALHPDLLSMVASIKVLRPHQSLTRRDISIDVGRVNVHFDSIETAAEFYDRIQSIRLEGGPLWKLRHFAAGKPGIVSPGILWLVMEAWITMGGQRLNDLLNSSLRAYL
ncbi:hypothetical protein BCR44DRAFT_1497237 [Catenaria anguillulae PL171]|uniref:RRM domain-containing protein n=1 Tax=Catenaria anguillulae PL171 TaxID=765915 RepID=A0A1Y2HVL0_9FUNG|nr:hypothetical protein BCR44DRAFT_1497237 [Catenaria anguillulae PL171]